ncbi:MAG: NADPH-dependent glutamate synthase [Anaerolineae bacterium]
MASQRRDSLAPPLDKQARKERLTLPPQPRRERPVATRLMDFEEIAIPFTPEEAIAEANRCLLCPSAPCRDACLAENDLPGAMWLIGHGQFMEAATLYRQTSALPEICGRVCPQSDLCEGACVHAKKGAAVALGRLEAFVADYARQHNGHVQDAPPSGRRVAVIGSGPAGLSVADRLRQRGHAVTIYEALPQPGGLLVYGIPAFKLDKQLVQARIADLQRRGVTFICGTRVGKDVPFESIRADFDAVFIGVGASVDSAPDIEGADLPGVEHATPYLIRANLPPAAWPPDYASTPLTPGQRITIFGGGDTAMDCARSALRMQHRAMLPLDVVCIYRRTEAQMPGNPHDRQHAREEGLRFEFLASPRRFIAGPDGRLSAVECVRMALGEPDASGRQRPVEIPGSAFTVPTDQAVLAFGYHPDPLLTETVPALKADSWGLILADPETGQTSIPGVFAGGDAVTGPNLVGRAMAAALRAASAIDAYLQRL